jgi:hypothetical protein
VKIVSASRLAFFPDALLLATKVLLSAALTKIGSIVVQRFDELANVGRALMKIPS